MRDDEFEWDDRKAARNVADHGVTFEVARDAFKDPFGTSRPDESMSYGEDRYTLLAMVDGRLMHVTFTYQEDRIRIISARGAEPRERRRYHEDNSR